MQKQIFFSETQKFNQIWIWILMILLNSLTFWGLIQQVIFKIPFGNKPTSDLGLIIISIISLLITFFMFKTNLNTQIKSDGIYIRFFPININYGFYSWESISKIYIRQYSPLKEYGGWGLRLGLFGKGKAVNISGNMGLQLEFKNGKRLLIGTNKAEQLAQALKTLGKFENY